MPVSPHRSSIRCARSVMKFGCRNKVGRVFNPSEGLRVGARRLRPDGLQTRPTISRPHPPSSLPTPDTAPRSLSSRARGCG
jgi:hypothetical protein